MFGNTSGFLTPETTAKNTSCGKCCLEKVNVIQVVRYFSALPGDIYTNPAVTITRQQARNIALHEGYHLDNHLTIGMTLSGKLESDCDGKCVDAKPTQAACANYWQALINGETAWIEDRIREADNKWHDILTPNHVGLAGLNHQITSAESQSFMNWRNSALRVWVNDNSKFCK